MADKPLPIAGFAIDGYRTLSNVEVVARGPLTVICGPNNTGKSSFLRALAAYPACAEAAISKAPPSQQGPPFDTDADVRARVAVDTRSDGFLNIARAQLQRNARREKLALDALARDGSLVWIEVQQRSGRIGLQADCLQRLDRLLHRVRYTSEAANAIRAIGDDDSPSPTARWAANVARNTLTVPTVKFIPDVRRTLTEPLTDQQLFRLAQASSRTTAGARRERWAASLTDILQDVFGPETLYEVTPQPSSGDFMLRIDGEDDLPLNHAGAGVREVVAIAHAALTGGDATVLCIEEPENCLHPNAVRRLLDSLVTHTEAQLFVTTHAAAVVNASPLIVHLSRTDNVTTSTQVDLPSQRFEAVRALGYSPADLVLTPCAVWVEGPSDRVYLSAWLQQLGIHEGVDYQMMFYGGSLAVHLTTASDVEPGEALAAIRQLSRRCVVVTDSDRDRSGAALKDHVERFTRELDGDEHGLHIVTWGREVENYLPVEIANRVRAAHEAPELPVNETRYRYEKVINPRLNKRVSKVAFAHEALKLLGGEIPPLAEDDVERIAEFIRASDPRRKD